MTEEVTKPEEEKETPVEAPKKPYNESKGSTPKKVQPKQEDPLEERKRAILRDLNTAYTTLSSKETQTDGVYGRAHYLIYSVILSVLEERVPEHARSLWIVLSGYIREHKEEWFNPQRAFTHVQHWVSDEAAYDLYRKMLFILIRYTIGELKNNQHNVDLTSLISTLSIKQRQNFVHIYNLN